MVNYYTSILTVPIILTALSVLPQGAITAQPVQEVAVSRGGGAAGWLDAHVVAGVVSAVLLAAALVICVCVAVRRQRYGGYR